MISRRGGRLGAAFLAALVGSGCAAQWAYRQGRQAAGREDWDLAVARYTRALEKDRDNIRYKIALENARLRASGAHYDEAKKHLAANDLERAAEELQIAVNYDPANRSASDDLALIRARIRERQEEQEERARYDEIRSRAARARVPVPVLSPRSPVPITLKFQDASLEKIFDTLARISGVNILFDETFRDKPRYSVNLTGVTFQEALDQLTFVNRLFYKVLDQNTIIVVPESRQKRSAYDELVLRTFYLQNAEVDETVTLVKTLARIQLVAGNKGLGSVTVLGTLDQVAIAERIIGANDKARGEVVAEVRILEINRNNLKRWGLDLSNYAASATLSPTGAEDEVAGGFTNVRAHVLSSLNQADWVASIPSTIFARFLETESTVRILASPRLRAAEGKRAELRIGTEVPVPITTFTAGAAGGVGTYLPATNFQYRNVGVNLEITPRVSASGDITLEMRAEFSLLGDDRNVGSEGNPLNVPTFLTRNVTGVLRLRDGETGLIGGLLLGREASSLSGALGLSRIPIIGTIFGDHENEKEESEVVISITPRIVRAPKLTEADLTALRVGTQDVPKVEGARPGLFGEETQPLPAPAEPPGAAPAPPPPPAEPTAVPAPIPAEAPPPGAGTPGAAAETRPAPAAPARPVTVLLSPPEASVRVGEAGGLALVLVGVQDLRSVEIVASWDPAIAQVSDVAAGSLLTLDGLPVATERALESGRLRVKFSRSAGATGSGAVASLTVRGVSAGTAAIAVESVVLDRAGTTERPAPPAPGRLVVSP